MRSIDVRVEPTVRLAANAEIVELLIEVRRFFIADPQRGLLVRHRQGTC